MAHAAEIPTLALTPSKPRKRLILLCSEDLRPIACCAEDALRDRGWEVDVEFGSQARPWVQKTPVGRPSLRVLCIPGTVDRTLAAQLRAAYRPEPDADLHILGVDDPRGLVQEIERLAGVRMPRRRATRAMPRLSHATLVEQQVQTDRGWRAAATTVAAALAIVVGGGAVLQHATIDPSLAQAPVASLAALPITSTPMGMDDQAQDDTSRFDDPVFSAVAPMAFDDGLYDDDDDDAFETPPEEEDDLIIFDDEPSARPSIVTPVQTQAPSLDEAEPMPPGLALPAIASPLAAPSPLAETTLDPTAAPLELPPGFLPVAGLSVTQLAPKLPPGFLPVAGMTAITTHNPFTAAALLAAENGSAAPTVDADGQPTARTRITYDPFVSTPQGSSPASGASPIASP